MRSIFDYVYFQRGYKKLKQSVTYFIYALGNILKGVVPSHGGTQKWYFFDRVSDYAWYSSILPLMQEVIMSLGYCGHSANHRFAL